MLGTFRLAGNEGDRLFEEALLPPCRLQHSLCHVGILAGTRGPAQERPEAGWPRGIEDSTALVIRNFNTRCSRRGCPRDSCSETPPARKMTREQTRRPVASPTKQRRSEVASGSTLPTRCPVASEPQAPPRRQLEEQSSPSDCSDRCAPLLRVRWRFPA